MIGSLLALISSSPPCDMDSGGRWLVTLALVVTVLAILYCLLGPDTWT